MALAELIVVGFAGEEQLIGVGGAVGVPVRAVVYLAVIAGLNTIGPRQPPSRA